MTAASIAELSPGATIVGTLTRALAEAQRQPFEKVRHSPLPLMLWDGDGNAIKASSEVLRIIGRIAERVVADGQLETGVTDAEARTIVGRAVAKMALEQPRSIAWDDPALLAVCLDALIADEVAEARVSATYYFGCVLIAGETVAALTIGPATFEPRHVLIDRLGSEASLPAVTVRRVKARLSGQRRRVRSDPVAQAKEDDLVDTLANSPWSCTVRVGRQSAGMRSVKAMQAARIAMTAIALAWERPSAALKDMALATDAGLQRRTFVIQGEGGQFGFHRAAIGSFHGAFVNDWQSTWDEYRPVMAPIADALWSYVDPERDNARSSMLKSLFMAMWWFDEACRSESHPMAIAKFASALDSLAAGQRAKGIKNLIHRQLGRPPDKPWFTDGKTPAEIVHVVYERARNGMYHGSMRDFDHDWSGVRELAEYVSRQCLLATLNWLVEHPSAHTLKAMQGP